MPYHKKKKKGKRSFRKWELVVLYLTIPYSLVYLLLPHDLHIRGLAIDHFLGNIFGFEGFVHPIHILIGSILFVVAVFIIWRRKFR